jgi:hypothetical protein
MRTGKCGGAIQRCFFDIVNGFLIDAVTLSLRTDYGRGVRYALLQMSNLAEIIVCTYDSTGIMQV